MNIFYLSENPVIAARLQCDKHVVKMTLESAQILSSVMHLKGVDSPYKPTHLHHPCVLWAANSLGNYRWLLAHFNALLSEYRYRYERTHKCRELLVLFNLFNRYHEHKFKAVDETLPALAMPDSYKQSDPVLAYQAYYRSKPSEWITAYTKRNIPEFLL